MKKDGQVSPMESVQIPLQHAWQSREVKSGVSLSRSSSQVGSNERIIEGDVLPRLRMMSLDLGPNYCSLRAAPTGSAAAGKVTCVAFRRVKVSFNSANARFVSPMLRSACACKCLRKIGRQQWPWLCGVLCVAPYSKQLGPV